MPQTQTAVLAFTQNTIHPRQNCYVSHRTTDISRKMSTKDSSDAHESFQFGPFAISKDHVFYTTTLSVAFVNLRPIVPGHVLVMPRRVVPLLSDLTADEYTDLWQAVRVVQQDILQKHYFDNNNNSNTASSPPAFNIAIQDGPTAGQTVPHVHVHILPRQAGDYERNDDIYTDIEEWAPRDCIPRKHDTTGSATKLNVPADEERKDRTVEQMAQEAALYRSFL